MIYSLSGTDASAFTVNSSTGVVTINDTPSTTQVAAANGVRANLVVYRVAAHMYRSLLRL